MSPIAGAQPHRPRIAVIGLGSTGSMAAWQLAEHGAEVTAFEQFWPGHDAGAAGGGTRMFRRIYAEGGAYGPLVEQSLRMWRRLERVAGVDLLHRTGGLSIGPREHPVVAGGLADAGERGLAHEVLDAAAMSDRFPQHVLRDGEIALFDPEAGVLRSNEAVVAAARRAARLGAELRTRTRVDEVSENATGVTVSAGGTAQHFDGAVITAGPWAQRLLPHLPLEVRAVFHTWHGVTDQQLLRPERHPIVLRRSGDDSSFATMSALDGRRVKFAPHFAYPRNFDSVEAIDRSVRTEWQLRSADLIARLLPGVDPEPVEARIYADSFTPDGHPAIGHLDTGSKITVLAGFSGHGFKIAPALGLAAAQLALEGASSLIPVETDLHRDFHAQHSIRDLVLSSEPAKTSPHQENHQ